MKKIIYIFWILLFSVLLDSCAVVGGIFKAGVWVGVLIVAAVIGLIAFLASRGKK